MTIQAEYLIPGLVFVAVIAVGAGILLARSIRLESLRTRLGPAAEPVIKDRPEGMHEGSRRVIGAVGRALGVSRASPNLRRQLMRAGYHGETPVAVFLSGKILLLVIGLGLFFALVSSTRWQTSVKAITILGGATIMFFIPNMIIQLKASRRTAEIRSFMPDAVDLLEICVSGGMGLDQAWNVVTDEISNVSMLLGDEMAFTNLEIHLGASRSEAMRHMGDRTGCHEAWSMAATLTQSEQFGTSIGETLRVFAASMREARSLQAAEIAEKMAVKLLFPLVFFIFPAILIVVAGPAGIEWAKVIGAGRR